LRAIDYLMGGSPDPKLLKEKEELTTTLKRYKDALVCVDARVPFAPDDPKPWAKKARLMLAMGDADGALKTCEEARSLSIIHSSIGAAEGEALLALGRGAEAIQRLESAADAGDREGRLTLSRAFISMGRLPEAAKAALAFDAKTPFERVAKGNSLLAAGANEDAANELEAALKSNDSFGDAWLGLGESRLASGDLKGAAKALDAAIGSGAGSPAWIARAKVHTGSGKPKMGVICAREALKLEPDSEEAMVVLADALEASGDTDASGKLRAQLKLKEVEKKEEKKGKIGKAFSDALAK